MNLNNFTQNVLIWLAAFGLKVLGAIALWVIGRWLISFTISLMRRALMKRPIEPTIINYLASSPHPSSTSI